MNTRSILLLAVLCGCVHTAQAQWQWLDDAGRKVFSDRPPPPGVPEKNVLRKPAAPPPKPTANPPGAPTSTTAAAPVPTAAQPTRAARPTGSDPELAARKAEQEAAEARKKAEEEQRVAQQRQENCNRAQRARAALQSGQMLAHTNAQGERGFLDDATRQQELERTQQVIGSDCG